MKWKHSISGSALLISAFIIVACSSGAVKATSPVLTSEMNLAGPPASLTPGLSPTNTDIEITPTQTRTPHPTNAPTRASTPTATENLWTSIALPDWVDDRNTPVLLGVYGTYPDFYDAPSNPMALWNGQTGEHFDINVPDGIGYYWLPDGSAFGLLSKDLTMAWEVNLASGLVTTFDVPASSVEFVPTSYDGLIPLKALSIPGQTGYSYRPGWDSVSPDGRFVVESKDDHDILVYDLYLGKTFNLAASNNQLFNIMASWSPVEPYLAVLRSDVEVGPYYSTEGPANWSIAIYNVLNRQLLAIYDDMFWVNWSPDGTKFLYQRPSPLVWARTICVFDRLTGVSKCFEGPKIKHKANTSDEITFSSLRWLPDSRSFSYLYYTSDRSNQNVKAGICFLTIEDGSERCILEQIDQYGGVIGEGPFTVRYYWPSPDWKVLLFEIDTACDLCDFYENPRLGFVDMQTGQSIMLDAYMEIYQTLWGP